MAAPRISARPYFSRYTWLSTEPTGGLAGMSSLASHSSTLANVPGLGATAMMVLMRSMGRNLTLPPFSESA